MTPEQVYLIRKSFAELCRHDEVAALVFYRRLFEIEPNLRAMFKNSIEEQSRKLLETLGVLVAMLERPAGLDFELRALGFRHAGYGVKDEHYPIVGEALLGMLGEVLDHQFTPQVREAWTNLYSAVETIMKRGAAEAGHGSQELKHG